FDAIDTSLHLDLLRDPAANHRRIQIDEFAGAERRHDVDSKGAFIGAFRIGRESPWAPDQPPGAVVPKGHQPTFPFPGPTARCRSASPTKDVAKTSTENSTSV